MCADDSHWLTTIQDIPGRFQALHLARNSRKLAPKRLERMKHPLYTAHTALDELLAKAADDKAKLASQHSVEVPTEKISAEDEQFTQPQSFSNEIKASELLSADTEVTISPQSSGENSRAVTASVQISNETSNNSSGKQISTKTFSDTTISSFNTLDVPTVTETVSNTKCDSDEETLTEHNQITGCSDTHNDSDDTDATLHLSEIQSSFAGMKVRENSGNEKDTATLNVSPEDVTHAGT